jgi:archaellum biogenesis ATPase FlaH
MGGVVLRKEQCPECSERGNDTSGDNLVRYQDNSAHCFACGYNETVAKKRSSAVVEQVKTDKPKITDEQNSEIKTNTTFNIEYRGIRKETHKFFGVRYEMVDGQPVKQYCPTTIKNSLSGYKPRTLPKTFGGSIGLTGMECDLFGQFRFKGSKSRDCLIVGGEIDALSAYQMLRDYQISRGNGEYDAVAVVSPTVGESGCGKQIQAQFNFFNRFERIIIGFDSDDAGKEGAEKIIPFLPKGKVYIAEWTKKDPNEYLVENETKRFVSDFYAAKKHMPVGVVGSGDLYDRVLENANTVKIPLPPFMSQLQEMMAGGIPLGYIVNFGSASGTGKTSIINEILYHWIFNSQYLVGVVSLELDCGQYGEVLLSRHLQKKIALMKDTEEKMDYLKTDFVKQKAKELFTTENGENRFHLLDDRDGSIDNVKTVIEELVVSCGCRIIMIDPLQDLLDGLSNEDQSLFMRWQKSFVKSHGVTFFNVNHTRKNQVGSQANSAGAWISEEDFQGSSSIFKSAGANILMTRNKYADDPIEKNTTHIIMSKCRWSGNTGHAGDYYYDNGSHMLHNKLEYFPDGVPERVDW